MRHNAVSSLFRRTAALILAAVLALPTVYAAAGEGKLRTAVQVAGGLTYENTVTVNNTSRVESFSLELEEDSALQPILLQGSGTVYGASNINTAVKNAQEKGYRVVAAVNTDFFSTATGVPLGIVIEDGVYKADPAAEDAMLITDGRVALAEDPRVSLTLTNGRTGEETTPNYFNRTRTESGGVYLLNGDFSTVSTRTSTQGWFVRMKLTDVPEEGESWPALTVNSTLELEVTELVETDQALTIGEGEYLLTASQASGCGAVFQSFQVGDRITLTTSCEDEALSAAQWAGGVGDIMVRDGALTDPSDWEYINGGRAPRTALGMKEDGTLVVYAVDGRQSGYSMGLSQKDLAEEMLARGCVWAVNLDGGGSTALSVWLPGQTGPKVQSSPSDGRPRSCATYLMLVSGDPGDGEPDRLALSQDGLVVLAGSSVTLPGAVAVDSGLNPLDVELDDLEITSQEGLGTVEDGVYTAGQTAGTDTLYLYSDSLDVEGAAQIHVVDALTELTVTRAGESGALSALTVEPGESVQLSVSGSYWGREALRDFGPVTWTAEGDVGALDETGLFTASESGAAGSLTLTAGGVSQTLSITQKHVHNDVPEGHWAYGAVEYCYANGIVGGISATEYGVDQPIRRGDFMLMLYGAVGRPAVSSGATFTDVSSGDYYYTAVSWAQENGLASGTGEGRFSSEATITREQAFTILRQAMPLLGKECPDASLSVLDQFADKELIADYARQHTATLVAQGVVAGKETGVDPQGSLTRAEMAVLLHKIITYTPIEDVPTDPAEPEEPEEPTGPGEAQEHTLTLDQTAVTLASGESAALTATLTPAVEGAQIVWTSSSPNTAAVSSSGVVTNLFAGVGTPVVTVTASWEGHTASCQVTCQQAEQTGVVINAESGLNVRSGPSLDHAVIGGVDNGTWVVVLDSQEGWCHILYLNREGRAAIGYVSADYLVLTQG